MIELALVLSINHLLCQTHDKAGAGNSYLVLFEKIRCNLAKKCQKLRFIAKYYTMGGKW